MMQTRTRAAWALVCLLAAGCGGSIAGAGGTGDDGPGDPGSTKHPGKTGSPGGASCPSSVIPGDTCGSAGQACASTTIRCSGAAPTCSCEDGTWSCDIDGVDCDEESPPLQTSCPAAASVRTGSSCHADPDLRCTGSAADAPACDGGEFSSVCACTGGRWLCDTQSICAGPTDGCPVAASIVPGGSCLGSAGAMCISSNVTKYDCDIGKTSLSTGEECVCVGSLWRCPDYGPGRCPAPSPPPPCPERIVPYLGCIGGNVIGQRC